MRQAIRRILAGCVLLLYVAAFLAVRGSLEQRRNHVHVRPSETEARLPESVLVPLSLRFREALADLFWVHAILYFALHTEESRPPVAIADIFDDLLVLDPYFKQAYRTASFLTRKRPIPAARAVEESVEYLRRGSKMFPDDWEFDFYAGAAYLVDMPASSPDETRRNQTLAAEYIRRAAILGIGRGAPDWLPLLAATVLTEIGQQEVAMRQLEDAFLAAPDEASRAKIRGKIIQLRGRVEADRAREAVQAFVRGWSKSFPYVSLDMAVLLGDRVKPGVVEIRHLANESIRALLEETPMQDEQAEEAESTP